jgi:protein-L-isoaspartate O-methyltransferase
VKRKSLDDAACPVARSLEAVGDTWSVLVVRDAFPAIARRVVELAEIDDGHRELEPSAGTGNLLAAIGDAPEKVAVEINPQLVEMLARCGVSGVSVRQGDFLEMNDELGEFDRVVMNPPFNRGADIEHVEHARKFLKPGGRLMAVVANGPWQRERLLPVASAWIDLLAGSFRAQGTNVNAAIVIADRWQTRPDDPDTPTAPVTAGAARVPRRVGSGPSVRRGRRRGDGPGGPRGGVAGRAACQPLRLGFGGDPGPDERVETRPVPLHRLPLLLLAHRVRPVGLPLDRHPVDDPRQGPPRLVLRFHWYLPATGAPGRDCPCPATMSLHPRTEPDPGYCRFIPPRPRSSGGRPSRNPGKWS